MGLTRADCMRLNIPWPDDLKEVKPSKYRNVPTEYGGVRYASKSEAKRAMALDLLVRRGEVLWWIGQPTFRLGCSLNIYKPDFLVVLASGDVHVEDVKGTRTAKFKRDVRLWKQYGPCALWVISKNDIEIVIGGLAK